MGTDSVLPPQVDKRGTAVLEVYCQCFYSPSVGLQVDCPNFIHVLQPLNSTHLYTCGSYAYSPQEAFIVSSLHPDLIPALLASGYQQNENRVISDMNNLTDKFSQAKHFRQTLSCKDYNHDSDDVTVGHVWLSFSSSSSGHQKLLHCPTKWC